MKLHVLLLTLFALTHTAFAQEQTAAPADNSRVAVALARDTQESCDRSILALTYKLKRFKVEHGKISCVPVEGEPDAYQPRFELFGPYQASSAAAASTDTLESCYEQLRDLKKVAITDRRETLVEATCVTVHTIDISGDKLDRAYQPQVFLIRNLER